jgi:hypothetical protein
MSDDHQARDLLEQARESVQDFPRHEPSHWLRTTAEAALRFAAVPGRFRPGLSVIMPLVPTWPASRL